MAGLTHNYASQNTECCLRRWFFHQVGSDTANYLIRREFSCFRSKVAENPAFLLKMFASVV